MSRLFDGNRDVRVIWEKAQDPEFRGQTYHEQVVVKTDGGVFRLTVHGDTYDQQAYLQAEVWRTGGWAEVITDRGPAKPLPSGHAVNSAEKRLPEIERRMQVLLAAAEDVTAYG